MNDFDAAVLLHESDVYEINEIIRVSLTLNAIIFLIINSLFFEYRKLVIRNLESWKVRPCSVGKLFIKNGNINP